MHLLRAMTLAAIVVTLPPAAVTSAAAQMPGYGPGYMGGQGMMGGYGPGYGHMGGYGPGYMMGPGMMQGYGPGYMMGPGYGPGMMRGYGYGPGNRGDLNLGTDQVKSYLERMIAIQGNARLKVGEVKEKDADTIVADIVTKEGNAMVQRFVVNRHNGFYQPEQ